MPEPVVSIVPGSGSMWQWQGVQGYLLPADARTLYRMAFELPEGGKIVEVGSFMGLSACCMIEGLKDAGNRKATVYCVDTWLGSVEHHRLALVGKGHMLGVFKDNLERLDYIDQACVVKYGSPEAANIFMDGSVDLIFIDGAHDYESVRTDIEAWWPKCRGRFTGHDCAEGPNNGVERAVREFAARVDKRVRIHRETHGLWELY